MFLYYYAINIANVVINTNQANTSKASFFIKIKLI